jgi:hypothetical protein
MVDYCDVNLSPWQCGTQDCIKCQYNNASRFNKGGDTVADKNKYMRCEDVVKDILLLAGVEGKDMCFRVCDQEGNLYLAKTVTVDASDNTIWLDIDPEEVDDEIPSASDITA